MAISFSGKNEAKKQMRANGIGKAYTKALELIKQADPHAEVVIDDYLVTIAFEKAAGWYVLQSDGTLSWQEPLKNENVHCEVIVQDRNDLRFLPYLDIFYRLFDKNENEIGTQRKIDFIWHPFLYHYAEDWSIPGEGEYSAEILIKKPEFRRHDQIRGKKYLHDVRVKIGPVHIVPGIKLLGPE